MRYVSVDDVLSIQRKQIKRFGGDKSNPNDAVRNCIEAAIAQPRQHVFDTELYPTVAEKAAAYLYFIVKRHCFTDGNKRVALHVALLFLLLNGWQLDQARSSPRKAVKLVLDVVNNRCSFAQLSKWFRRRIVGSGSRSEPQGIA